jgi:hypothetical protein
MQDHSPLSPEERRKQFASLSAAFGRDVAEGLQRRAHWWDVIKRVVVGVYNDGFIHAGNLAFLALLALFPFSSSPPPSRRFSARLKAAPRRSQRFSPNCRPRSLPPFAGRSRKS